MARITVVGAGAIGSAIADRLSLEGHSVTVVSQNLVGAVGSRDEITTTKAAGIGCIFKPSSPFVGKLVLDSYEAWMALARDRNCRSVMVTDLKIVTQPNEKISYESQVEGFTRLDENSAQYRTYSFNPTMLVTERLERMRAQGVEFQKRSLTAEEISGLAEGIPLNGSDYTVEAVGLAARDLHPELRLFPIAGVLVHYIDPETAELRDSYMHENKAVYVVTRPSSHGREIILGGTFLEHVSDVSVEDQIRWKEAIRQQVQEEFSRLGFNPRRADGNPSAITVGLRPGRVGDPVIEQRGKVSIVTGFGGQGLVTNFALAKLVSEQIGSAFVDTFPGVSLPPAVGE